MTNTDTMHFKIGTRSSNLALWQAYYIGGLLENAGYKVSYVKFETIGDKKLEVAIQKIGSKGVFTEELEAALRSGEIDIAVHSAKDLPSEMPDDLTLLAFTEREESYDVVVSFNPEFKLGKAAPNTIVGSSSTRRRAMLNRHYPHLKLVDMRGNLNTRFQKLQNGEAEAMLLAYAGVKRLGFEQYIVEQLPAQTFIPPAGQGSVAVQALTSLNIEKQEVIKSICNHPETALCVQIERAFLNELQGGCSIPVCANAKPNGRFINFKAGLFSLDGSQVLIQNQNLSSEISKAEQEARTIAQNILAKGGKEILAAIRAEQKQ